MTRFQIKLSQLVSEFGKLLFISLGENALFMFLFSYLLLILPPYLDLPSFSFWSILAFCTPMMASDSSFSLAVFKTRNCSSQLTTLMEGDAIISEAIAVLIFRLIIHLQFQLDTPLLTLESIVFVLQIIIGTLAISLVVGFASTVLLRTLHVNNQKLNLAEVAICVCIPISAYMLSDGFHFSPSITLRICGIYMARYSQFILNAKTYPFATCKLQECVRMLYTTTIIRTVILVILVIFFLN